MQFQFHPEFQYNLLFPGRNHVDLRYQRMDEKNTMDFTIREKQEMRMRYTRLYLQKCQMRKHLLQRKFPMQSRGDGEVYTITIGDYSAQSTNDML